MHKADILAEICATTRTDVARRKLAHSPSDLLALASEQTPPRGFRRALDDAAASGFGLIAEIKRASPSKGLIRKDFNPPEHACAYAGGGAACLSVLTDTPYFQGQAADLIAARASCALPVLRKDFMIDPWQVFEARAIGADAILIIMACTDDVLAADLEAAATALDMDVLVEAHNAEELDRALKLKSRLIGVNNRNLKTFEVNFKHSYELLSHAPKDCTFVAESGLSSHADLAAMAEHGVRCFLVGESLMRQADLKAATKALLGR